ncbi:MAG: hypothetical protein M2R45_00952 [Verrucomicrobia subdivision 3 bacterium]|nr:hypothetical protein [Limisphaerales bacterium]MCS1414620.1 hypothetical protein [Limisphaerales bacterium]
MKKLLLLATLCVVATVSASAQGTVNFSNGVGGVTAPVSGPDGLLGAGFSAQLQLADGTNVGQSAPFLATAPGFFAGGTRTIDGVAGGEMATLQVAVLMGDALLGTSGQFTVTLGGVGTPPTLPTGLTGLSAFSISGIDPIPEPSTIVLALLGGSALLLRRRK